MDRIGEPEAMSLLDDPALNLRPQRTAARASTGTRVRFRPSSTFVRAFDLPERATGMVTGTYEQDGCQLAWVTVDAATGPLYATGVRLDEVERI